MLENLLLFIVLLGAVGALVCRQTIYALLSLIVVFLASASYMISQQFNFIGLIFIIVYVGAIAMLFLYMVMLLDAPKVVQVVDKWYSDFFLVGFLWLLSHSIVADTLRHLIVNSENEWFNNLYLQSNIHGIGLTFYSTYGFLLLLIGFFLFIAMIISVDIASKGKSNLEGR